MCIRDRNKDEKQYTSLDIIKLFYLRNNHIGCIKPELEDLLTQPYVAEKMGVTASTILRYENGSIDNTKKMVLEGLSEALHVSIEWLRGETDEYETDITDKKELQIRDAMGDILKQLPLDLSKKEDAFSKDLLLLMLKQYNLFLESFQFACKNYKGNTNEVDIAKVMGLSLIHIYP